MASWQRPSAFPTSLYPKFQQPRKKVYFYYDEYTTWEVKKHIPELSKESGVPESELFYAFDHFPIIAMPPIVYDEMRNQAENLIAHRDPKDVDILALAFKLDTPLWPNDKDFSNIHELKVFTTSDRLEKLAAPTN